MGVPLLDTLNYNIFDVSILPHQRKNAQILSKWVENIGNIFSQS